LIYQFQDIIYEFDHSCISTFEKHKQKSFFSREIGGQLFAKFTETKLVIEMVTVTKGKSRRSRFGFWPDRATERRDIQALFEQGLHYVGDWHTHPENHPTPSVADTIKIADIFRCSRHELDNLLIVIVGLAPFPKGLFVGSVTQNGITKLTPFKNEIDLENSL